MALRFQNWTRTLFLARTVLMTGIVIGGGTAYAQPAFHAGAASVDISPTTFPVRINGSFAEISAESVVDPLHARAMALDDGSSRLVFCVVDTCMMTRELIDDAKQRASDATGLATDRMMVSATHTHTAPAAMGCLGARQDPVYAAWLPGKIAEVITASLENLQPAKVGWASIDDWEHTHNRRWIRRADRIGEDPFGGVTVCANMHPGHESPDVVGPSGPVDPGLSLLAVKTLDGQPLAILANYSQHYYGSAPVSADYYGHFVRQLAALLGQSSSEGPFVAMMSQGTSGDLMWMDYGAPAETRALEAYAAEVAENAIKAYHQIEWRDTAPLSVAEKKIALGFRLPDEERLAWARAGLDVLGDKLPTTMPEVYAGEAFHLVARPEAELKLQAIRVGDLGITTLPNEVYAITGLKLKRQSPMDMHFNIELANGAEGYIPPPEQHTLGGYTTWPARTAGLEVGAEPAIVETLLGAMEEASGKPRKPLEDAPGPYPDMLMMMKPSAYWRLNDIAGNQLANAVPGGPEATLDGGYALYLPGVGVGSGTGATEALKPSTFDLGPGHLNRSVHFVGGRMSTPASGMDGDFSVALWFWLGEKSGASDRSGTLVTLPSGETLNYRTNTQHEASLSYVAESGEVSGSVTVPANLWHLAVLVREGGAIRVHVDGAESPDIAASTAVRPGGETIQFGAGLEGKLDEVAIFPGALSASNIADLWTTSGMEAFNAAAATEDDRAAAEAIDRLGLLHFAEGYADASAALQPIVNAALDGRRTSLTLEKESTLSGLAYTGGRIRGGAPSLGDTYSVSLWFKNMTPNEANPIAAYLFSRGPADDVSAAGDHLGIFGNYAPESMGKLTLYNGNDSGISLHGKSVIAPGSWNHFVLVRSGDHATVYLNGNSEPEIDDVLPATAPASPDFFLGARSDQFAPLNGSLASFTLFDRALTAAEAQQLFATSGMTPESLSAPRTGLASRPRSSEEGLKSIHVPEDLTVDLVAAEPLVLDPVAFDWDAQGRLWVVEMADYPLGLDGNEASGGRIRVLEDTDRDGTYDASKLFAEGLNFPNGILTWRDGIIVTAAPDILFLRDTDGDGMADEREVLLTGLTEGNQQLRANGLRWGLDNWVYVAAGGHHGDYGLETKIRSSRNNTEVAVGSRDFRFHPDTGDVEPQSGPTQFGRNRDDWGHWFGTQNSRPLWHYVLQDQYLKRNPYLATPDGRVQVLGAVNPPVYPASALEKRFHNFQESGRYTSACSGMIYRDEKLFPRDEMNGFACEPFHNVVQRIVMQPEGATFSGQRGGEEGAPDFFASEDRWCRPVMVRTGPDGALWIADMYRYMIEHPQWLPEEGKAELLPFYREGDDKGRIYRVRKSNVAPEAIIQLGQMNSAFLVAQLGSPNGWVRDKAQQLLLWQGDLSVVPALEAMAKSTSEPLARLHALCTLDGLGSLGEDLVVAALDDAHPGVRENALRLAETRMSGALAMKMAAMAEDPDAAVRLQLAFSLGETPPTPDTASALATLLLHDHADPFITVAALSSALPHQELLIAELAKSSDPAVYELRPALAGIALGAGNARAVSLLLASAFTHAQESAAAPDFNSCMELLDVLARNKSSVTALATTANSDLRAVFDKLITQASATMADEAALMDARIASAALIARVPETRAQAIDFLGGRFTADASGEEIAEALIALGGTGDDRTPDLVLAAWPTFNRPMRGDAIDEMLSRAPWAMRLLDAVAAGEVSIDDFDAVRRSRLLRHPDAKVREAANARLGAGSSPDKAKIIAEYSQALALPGDLAKGRAFYQASCSVCHRIGEEGIDMGPDLRTVSQHPAEKILTNILDPNLDIQPGFHAYNCELEDGEQLFGLIAAENATSITLKIAGGISRVILRSDIFNLESTGMSLMPEGWEASMTAQDMADLIAFLKSTY